MNHPLVRRLKSHPLSVLFLFLLFISFVLRMYVYSLFVTWDSVHYLQLSLKPVYGDSHSIIFGFVLKSLANIANYLNHPLLFREIVYILNIIPLWLVMILPISSLLNLRKMEKRKRYLLYLVSFLFWSTTFPSLLILVSALWTEMLYFGFLFVFIYFIHYFFSNEADPTKNNRSRGLIGGGIVFSFLFVIAYHVRFQMIIVPIALSITSLVFYFKGRNFPKFTLFWVVAALLNLIAFNSILKNNLPAVKHASNMALSNAIVSAQCTLRCDVELFKVNCRSDESKKIIEKVSCSDAAFGWVPLGGHVKEFRGFSDLFLSLGALKSIKWLIVAPFYYLKDIHKKWGLEIGRFEFLKDDATIAYPEATAYYTKFLQIKDLGPKFLFEKISQTISMLHFEVRLFNWLSGIVVVINVFLILRSRKFVTIFLSFITIGTLMVFAYFNPHVPFRFLIQIIVPGILAIFYELGSDSLSVLKP